MSRDINDILKEVTKSNKEIYKVDDRLSKEIADLQKDIAFVQKEVKTISSKVDEILELIHALYIFVEEYDESEPEEAVDEYESNEGWLPDIDNWERDSEQDEDD